MEAGRKEHAWFIFSLCSDNSVVLNALPSASPSGAPRRVVYSVCGVLLTWWSSEWWTRYCWRMGHHTDGHLPLTTPVADGYQSSCVGGPALSPVTADQPHQASWQCERLWWPRPRGAWQAGRVGTRHFGKDRLVGWRHQVVHQCFLALFTISLAMITLGNKATDDVCCAKQEACYYCCHWFDIYIFFVSRY